MITCKFTEEELHLMLSGLKFLANYGLKEPYIVANDDWNRQEALIQVSELRGNIKSLIRNNE